MKARLVRDSQVVNPSLKEDDRKLLKQQYASRQITAKEYSEKLYVTVPKGTVIDHPDAFWLVRNGDAEPADDECVKAADMTAEQMKAAQAAQEKRLAGKSLPPPLAAQNA